MRVSLTVHRAASRELGPRRFISRSTGRADRVIQPRMERETLRLTPQLLCKLWLKTED